MIANESKAADEALCARKNPLRTARVRFWLPANMLRRRIPRQGQQPAPKGRDKLGRSFVCQTRRIVKPRSHDESSSAKAAIPPRRTAATADPNTTPITPRQDVEVGTFYMHKGDVDAAIARFEDAIRLRANFAKPRLLLAEAYEKKNDKHRCEVLQRIPSGFPDAPDAKKIRKKIDKLSEDHLRNSQCRD